MKTYADFIAAGDKFATKALLWNIQCFYIVESNM
jgi:hypothetical protein